LTGPSRLVEKTFLAKTFVSASLNFILDTGEPSGCPQARSGVVY